MSGRHALPSRLGHFYREVAKFGVVGLAGVVVNVLAFNLIQSHWGLQTVRASVLATLISIVCNYVGFRFFTYRDRDGGSRSRELALFFGFSLIGLVIENSVLYVATYMLGWDGKLESNVFKFVGVGVATAFRFWSYRTWVFKALGEVPEESGGFEEPGGFDEAAAEAAASQGASAASFADPDPGWYRPAGPGRPRDRADGWPAPGEYGSGAPSAPPADTWPPSAEHGRTPDSWSRYDGNPSPAAGPYHR